MSKPIKIKINVSKLDKSRFFKGKNGTYVSLVAWPNRNGPDQYGNTHSVKQDKPKDDPAEMPFVGNLTVPDDGAPHRAKLTAAPRQVPDIDVDPDSVPF